jgi:hypothetical protein
MFARCSWITSASILTTPSWSSHRNVSTPLPVCIGVCMALSPRQPSLSASPLVSVECAHTMCGSSANMPYPCCMRPYTAEPAASTHHVNVRRLSVSRFGLGEGRVCAHRVTSWRFDATSSCLSDGTLSWAGLRLPPLQRQTCRTSDIRNTVGSHTADAPCGQPSAMRPRR